MVQTRPPSTDSSSSHRLEAARHGESWAWESLYRELIGPVTGYLRSRGARDADDVAAEVFLSVAKGIERFQGSEGSFRSWVFVIAHRRLIDERRTLRRRPSITDHLDGRIEIELGGDVEEEAFANLNQAWMKEIFEELTEDQREVLALRVIADLSLDDTAAVMGRGVGAVKALQRRALESARTMIEEGRVSV